MTEIPDWVRSRHTNKSRFVIVQDDVDDLERLYAGRSYALVRVPFRGGTGFVPLIPRHLTNDMWSQLWWHNIKKLVINGEVHKSLCSLCPKALMCIVDRKEKGSQFECRPVASKFHIDVLRRHNVKGP